MKSFITISLLILSLGFNSFAQSDTALSFDGRNDFVEASFAADSNSFSLDFFFRSCSNDSTYRVLLQIDSLQLSISTAPTEAFFKLSDRTSSQNHRLNNFKFGEWNHCAIEFNKSSSQLLLLLNGATIAANSKSSFARTGKIILGKDPLGLSFFEGQVDNLRYTDSTRFGFSYTSPLRPLILDSMATEVWNFDQTTDSSSMGARGRILQLKEGTHGITLYQDLMRESCAGDTLEFDFSGAGYAFQSIPSSNSSWDGRLLQMIAPVQSDSFQFVFSDSNSCINSLNLDLQVFSKPQVDLGNDSLLCDGDSLLFRGIEGAVNRWSDGSNADSLWVSSGGVYWLEVTDSNNCKASDTSLFVGLNAPQIELGNDTTLPRFGTLVLDAGPGFVSYQWSSLETAQSILATLPNWYWVEVTDSNGCRGRDSIYVLIEGLFPFGVEEKRTQDDFSVWPNPASNQLNIREESNYTFSSWVIMGFDGQLLNYEYSPAHQIDISNLSNGQYMLWIQREDGKLISYKFIKASR